MPTEHAPIRVVSIPEHHPYVEAILDPVRIHRVPARLPDPAAAPEPQSGAEPVWAPPEALDAEWVHENHARCDVVHVHFGFESFSPEHIARFIGALRAHGTVLFVTVHDLSNPQLPADDQGCYRAALELLVLAADRVITLTSTAAAEILQRWGVRAVVIDHPPQLTDLSPSLQGARSPRRIGVLLKDARPSLDLEAVGHLARALHASNASAEASEERWLLDVVHHGRFRAGRDEAVLALLEELAGMSGTAVVVERSRMSDAELIAWIADLGWLALPYGHGTHSGLLELANDLGVRALVTDRGHFAAQRPGCNAVLDFHDDDAVRAALANACALGPLTPATPDEQRRVLQAIRREHVLLYRRAVEPLVREHSDQPPLRILMIGPFRYPLRQPHPGGLESHVWSAVQALRERGHQVTLAAPEGSDFLDGTPPDLVYERFDWPDGVPRTDSGFPQEITDLENRVMRRAMAYIADHAGDWDVIHNQSLHSEPHRWAGRLGTRMLTTLHTPPIDEILEVVTAMDVRSDFVAVSHHTARAWTRAGVPATVIRNGVDTAEWTFGAGERCLTWFGRIVPEKAPHLAIMAAQELGLPILLAGAIGDPSYAAEHVLPLCTGPGVWPPTVLLGPLRQRTLASLVQESACTLITPAWDEPFGLVVAESLACGTPVVALRRGGLGEVFSGLDAVRLVDPGDDDAETARRLAAATADLLSEQDADTSGSRLRWAARHTAVTEFSFDRTIDALERAYGERAGGA